MLSHVRSFALTLPFLAFALGCGSNAEKVVAVKGQLTKGGAPFSPKEALKKPLPPGDAGVRVVFKRADGPKAGEEFGSNVDAESGKFEAVGAAGTGIPPGKYTVSVYLGAYGSDDAPKGKPGATGIPPTGGGAPDEMSGNTSMGKAVATLEVTIPPEGKADLTIEIDDKKGK